MKQFNFSGVVGWDVMPGDVRKFLFEAAGQDVKVLFSSPGGFVGDALEIFNLIRNYGGHVTAVLSGYAMSAASYIPLAADKIVAEDNAVYMIHNARGGVWGDHNYILKYGRETEALSKLLAGAYVKHTGRELAEIQAMMDEETFFYGQEIVDEGFAHEVAETEHDEDRDNHVTFAKTAYRDCNRKLSENVQMTADDLARAAAIAQAQNQKTHRAEQPATQPKEYPMDLTKLKKDHADLVAALSDEILTGLTLAALTAANPELASSITQQGAENERNRIEDVRAQLIPGHEKLIAGMELDGKSTGADAAKAIVAAEKESRKNAQTELENNSNPAVPPGTPPEGDSKKEMKLADWSKLSPKAQNDFINEGGVLV